MFLFLLSLVTEEDLIEKINSLEKEAKDKYEELYSIQKELENIKTQDSKLRNRLSYISNSKSISYTKPKLITKKLPNSEIIIPKFSFGFSKQYSLEYYNQENYFINSINIKFNENDVFPNEFSIDLYVGKEKIELPKQQKQAELNIILPSPIQASKIVISWNPKNTELETSIPSVSISGYASN